MERKKKGLGRRDFFRVAGAAGVGATLFTAEGAGRNRPNVLWITFDDLSPDLGCYGDDYATTPNLDRLADQGVRYTRAFATAPVCSPARSCLITGLYATSTGTQNLRSYMPIPDRIRGWPSMLRRKGYHTTNKTKTDYNTADENRLIKNSWVHNGGKKAHWRSGKKGQPFCSIFNKKVTHQSRCMVWPYEKFEKKVQSQLDPDEVHDPLAAPIPPYYPDTDQVQRTMARYYDCVTAGDKQVGRLLDQLEEDGLAQDTIVMVYGDHGAGLPRHKRTLYDTGLRVPLIVRFPDRYSSMAPAEPGETVDRLVSFVDFPPTVLSMLRMPIPRYMQGRPFLGPRTRSPRRYVYGARDRVDEAYDMSRSVRDERYLYIRNYMPHLSWHQPSAWPGQGELRQHLTEMMAGDRLAGPQASYPARTRPVEELYDTEEDPHQLENVAEADAYEDVKHRLRRALTRWTRRTRDLGYLPEWEMRERSGDDTPYEMARDRRRYPLRRIRTAASWVGKGEEFMAEQVEMLEEEDGAIRYWGAVGLRAQEALSTRAVQALQQALDDTIGQANAEAFDGYGWSYYTRDVFDLHYPGYWDSYPSLHGATGLTYETDGGGGKGARWRRSDGTVLTLEDGIAHHFVAVMATLDATAQHREARLRDYYRFFAEAVETADAQSPRGVVLRLGTDPRRAARLATTLLRHGLQVDRITQPGTVRGYDVMTDATVERRVSRGAFFVPFTQPKALLARALLLPDVPLPEGFRQQELARLAHNLHVAPGEREPHAFYDVTAWNLALAAGVPALWTDSDAPLPTASLSLPDSARAAPANRIPPPSRGDTAVSADSSIGQHLLHAGRRVTLPCALRRDQRAGLNAVPARPKSGTRQKGLSWRPSTRS